MAPGSLNGLHEVILTAFGCKFCFEIHRSTSFWPIYTDSIATVQNNDGPSHPVKIQELFADHRWFESITKMQSFKTTQFEVDFKSRCCQNSLENTAGKQLDHRIQTSLTPSPGLMRNLPVSQNLGFTDWTVVCSTLTCQARSNVKCWSNFKFEARTIVLKHQLVKYRICL